MSETRQIVDVPETNKSAMGHTILKGFCIHEPDGVYLMTSDKEWIAENLCGVLHVYPASETVLAEMRKRADAIEESRA